MAVVVAAFLLSVPPAHAQDVAVPIACAVVADLLDCEVVADLETDAELRELLESGFTNHLVYRVYLFGLGDDDPTAVSVIAFAEVFRLYTDVYYVSQEGTEGYIEHIDWQSAASQLGRFDVSFGPAIELTPGDYFAVALLELNPLDEAALAEARNWISQSHGGYRLFGGEGGSFFGTFMSLFVDTDASGAEARRLYQSAPFTITAPPLPPEQDPEDDRPLFGPDDFEPGSPPTSLEPGP